MRRTPSPRPLHALHPQPAGCVPSVSKWIFVRWTKRIDSRNSRPMSASSLHGKPGWRERSMRWFFMVIAVISCSNALLAQEVRVLEFPRL